MKELIRDIEENKTTTFNDDLVLNTQFNSRELQELSNAIKLNTSIKTIYLKNDNIPVEILEILGEAVPFNRSIQVLIFENLSALKNKSYIVNDIIMFSTSIRHLRVAYSGLGKL